MSYNIPNSIMANGSLYSESDEDHYYLFSEGIEERSNELKEKKHENETLEEVVDEITDEVGEIPHEILEPTAKPSSEIVEEVIKTESENLPEIIDPVGGATSTDSINYNISTVLSGGDSEENMDTKNVPTGGFPPIFIIERKKASAANDKSMKSRELSTRTSSVSITDILRKKKNE